MANQLFDLLKQDHREAEQMMQKLSKTSQNQRETLFLDLNDALMQHMQIEEKFFYPKLQNQQGMIQLMKDALHEHQETKDLLKQLERMGAEASEWQQTFTTLQQGVLHHVQEEEQKVFPKCTEFLSDRELDDIAQKCRQEKEAMQPSRGTTGKETTKRI